MSLEGASVPFSDVSNTLKTACSQSIVCVLSVEATFAKLSVSDQERFMEIAREFPVLGIGFDADSAQSFADMRNAFSRHTVALLNLINFLKTTSSES